MGYLSNTVIEIDAILTSKGKELLSKGAEEFNITQFALADDEVDYRLWNPDHNLGSDYFGEMIENMPLVEATPNENQIMKYKLVSLNPAGSSTSTVLIPRVDAGYTEIVISSNQSVIITPTTVNSTETANNDNFGYSATLDNPNIATLTIDQPAPSNRNANSVSPELGASVTINGLSFKLNGKSLSSTGSGTLKIEGNETGGSVLINITVNPVSTTTGTSIL